MVAPKAWFSQNYRYIVFSILTTVLLFFSAHALFIRPGPEGHFYPFQHGPSHFLPPPPPPGRRPFRGPPGPPPPPGGFLEHRLAFQEKLYQDSVKERQELIRQFGPSPEGSESLDTPSSFNALWEFFTASFQCPHRLQRIGRLGDNPKWVCGFEHLERKKDCVVYSIGVSPDSSFEASILARAPGCQVFAYDIDVEKLGNEISSSPDFSKRAFLSTSSIGKRSDDNETEIFTLSSLMERNGHSFIDILKIDLEDGQLEALEAFFDDNDFPRLASARAPHPPRRISRRFPTFAPFLPIGQLQVALSSQEEAYGGIKAFSAWWQKLEKMGLRPFWAAPRLGAQGESSGMIDYSFINIRGDHELVADHRRRPPPPFRYPPPPPPPGFKPESHMHWYPQVPRGKRPSDKQFGEWELFAQDQRRPSHHGFARHPEFPYPPEFEAFPHPGKFGDRPEFPYPPPPPPPPHEFEGNPEFPHPHEFEGHPGFPLPPPPPPYEFGDHPEFPHPPGFEDHPDFPHPSEFESFDQPEMKAHPKPEETRLPESDIFKPEERPELDSEPTGRPDHKWRPMRGSSKARLGLDFWNEAQPTAEAEAEADASPEDSEVPTAFSESFDTEESVN